MISKAIGHIWSSMFGARGKKNGGPHTPVDLSMVLPITTGVRTKVALSTRSENQVPGSEILWICSIEEGRPSKALKVLLLPN
jgi:hypothetical protein